MISKETFVKTIMRLEELDNKMCAVDNAMQAFNNDFCGFYLTEPFDITLELLVETMEDKDEWIYYFIYERDWLKDYELGDIFVDGKAVEINNWEDVYDFIMEVNLNGMD